MKIKNKIDSAVKNQSAVLKVRGSFSLLAENLKYEVSKPNDKIILINEINA